MYIWILLASIMVALSFFNLHPRADQENAFSEIKVATLTRRFRLEHLAFTHAFECEAIYNRSNYNKVYKVTTDFDVGYTSFKRNLPIGYSLPDDPDAAGQPVHYIICLNNRGFSKNGELVSTEKCSGRNVYGVSFQKIPDRWISKQPDEDTGLYMPLPAFTSFLGTELTGMHNTGWIYCESDTNCHFSGKSAFSARYREKELHIEEVTFPPDLLKNQAFRDECRNQPCLFAYDRIRNVDLTEQGKNNVITENQHETAIKHCCLLMTGNVDQCRGDLTQNPQTEE